MLISLSLVLVAVPQTLTVGPGGFADIQSAIDAAVDGDVIGITGGTYDAFTLDKSLTLVATSGTPLVRGSTLVTAPSGFALSGLSFENLPGDNAAVLLVDEVAGRGRIDGCSVRSTEPVPFIPLPFFATPGNALVITDSADVVVTDTTARGVSCGIGISSSSPVAIVDCDMTGDDSIGNGGDGLRAIASDVVVAGGHAIGGDGGELFSCGNRAGHAIGVLNATLTVSSTFLTPGSNQEGCGLGDEGQPVGVLLQSFPPDGSLVHQDGTCITTSGSTYTCPSADARLPRLSVVGSPFALARTVRLFGPPLELGAVGLSLSPDAMPLPGIGQYLWIDLGAPLVKTFLFVTQTFDSPATKVLSLPVPEPALDGLAVDLQGFFPLVPGTGSTTGILSTNPEQLILRVAP